MASGNNVYSQAMLIPNHRKADLSSFSFEKRAHLMNISRIFFEVKKVALKQPYFISESIFIY